MDQALVTFVGAGLQVLAGGYGIVVPRGAARRGFDLVDHLVRFGGSDVNRLVVDVIAGLWKEWVRSGMPPDIAVQTINVLPAMIDAHRVDRGLVTWAMAASGFEPRGAALSPDTPSQRLAAAIVHSATGARAFEGTDVSAPIAFFFLERLFAGLIAERRLVRELRSPLPLYFALLTREAEAQALGLEPDFALLDPASPTGRTAPRYT
jgi:hypothetical protein